MKTIDKLVKFVNQRPGLDFCNYGDVRLYRSEMNEITRDKHDFSELLNLAFRRVENLEEKINTYLKNTSGRLSLNENEELVYITGQYFPTEYRPAACRVLSQIIWNSYNSETHETKDGVVPAYNDGHEIRKALKRNLSRRVMKNYFS